MTRAFADPGQRPLPALPDLLRRAGADLAVRAERLWDDCSPVRERALTLLIQATILACAAMAVVRRTDAYAQLRQWRRTAARAIRHAWARAEGFEMEAGAGIALVVLAVAILVHGFVTG